MKERAEQILDLSARIGVLLMENGGEVYRAEDTMQRICCSQAGIDNVEALATPGWLIITVKAEGETHTILRRVKATRNDLFRVAQVNEVSRDFVDGNIDIADAHKRLDVLLVRTPKQNVLQFVGGVLSPMCITLLGDAPFTDAMVAGAASACLWMMDRFLQSIGIFPFMRTLIDSMVGAFVSLMFFRAGFVVNIGRVLIGSIMLQFPGIMMANSVRDSLSGDMMTGQSEMVQALSTALALGMGVGFMLLLFGGDIQ